MHDSAATMRIDIDPKLDFKDVLIRPKRSTLASRSQVRISSHLRISSRES